MDPPVKPKPNLIMPTSPMFASIMAPRAKMLVKKLCKVRSNPGCSHHSDAIECVKEIAWNQGPGNDNLERRSLNVGTIGLVVGVAEPATVLRFLVTNDEMNDMDQGIYHVSVLNLEVLQDPNAEDIGPQVDHSENDE